jgi:hypothetical protein
MWRFGQRTGLRSRSFNKVSTQWRMGPGGPTGLDYNAAVLDDEVHEGQTHSGHHGSNTSAGVNSPQRNVKVLGVRP